MKKSIEDVNILKLGNVSILKTEFGIDIDIANKVFLLNFMNTDCILNNSYIPAKGLSIRISKEEYNDLIKVGKHLVKLGKKLKENSENKEV